MAFAGEQSVAASNEAGGRRGAGGNITSCSWKVDGINEAVKKKQKAEIFSHLRVAGRCAPHSALPPNQPTTRPPSPLSENNWINNKSRSHSSYSTIDESSLPLMVFSKATEVGGIIQNFLSFFFVSGPIWHHRNFVSLLMNFENSDSRRFYYIEIHPNLNPVKWFSPSQCLECDQSTWNVEKFDSNWDWSSVCLWFGCIATFGKIQKNKLQIRMISSMFSPTRKSSHLQIKSNLLASFPNSDWETVGQFQQNIHFLQVSGMQVWPEIHRHSTVTPRLEKHLQLHTQKLLLVELIMKQIFPLIHDVTLPQWQPAGCWCCCW